MLYYLRNKIKNSLTPAGRERLEKLQALRFRRLQNILYRCLFRSNLNALALVYNTDKWGRHWYTEHYGQHFARFRGKRVNVLEIGIGGYGDPEQGGGSLRMWRCFFPRGNIFGIDIEDKKLHEERRIKVFQGSQIDEAFLGSVMDAIGTVDIIIDDGSHVNEHVIRTFKFLFPLLSAHGYYAIEDTQTSYWTRFGGTCHNLNSAETTMGFFKGLVDGLHYADFELDDYNPSYFDKHIVAMHFYHNLILIQKGLNDEIVNIGSRSI